MLSHRSVPFLSGYVLLQQWAYREGVVSSLKCFVSLSRNAPNTSIPPVPPSRMDSWRPEEIIQESLLSSSCKLNDRSDSWIIRLELSLNEEDGYLNLPVAFNHCAGLITSSLNRRSMVWTNVAIKLQKGSMQIITIITTTYAWWKNQSIESMSTYIWGIWLSFSICLRLYAIWGRQITCSVLCCSSKVGEACG